MKKNLLRVVSVTMTLLICMAFAPPVTAFAASAYDVPGQKLVAITFDDGPGAYSDRVLDILKKHNAKATFFMVGRNVASHMTQVNRMAAEGHQIANHTYDHPQLAKCSWSKIQDEISTTSQLLTSATGLTGTGDTGFFLRPPYGSWNNTVASAAGVPLIMWSVDTQDWKYRSASRLVSYTSSHTNDGDIVLMHEIHKSTVDGLDATLTQLENQGFQMVTVDELMWRRGITPTAGKVYNSAKNTGVNRCARDLYFDESTLETHWAWDAIQYVLDKGYMSKNEYGEFTPNFIMTRGMLVTLLGRLAGVEAGQTDSGFVDVPADHYAAAYAAWAKEAGIMKGIGDDRFDVDGTVTREQMAVALARFAQLCGAEKTDFDLSAYADSASISDWAKDGVAFCSGLGLLKGDGTSYQPGAPATRAMGASLIQRLDQAGLNKPDMDLVLPDPSEGDEGTGGGQDVEDGGSTDDGDTIVNTGTGDDESSVDDTGEAA